MTVFIILNKAKIRKCFQVLQIRLVFFVRNSFSIRAEKIKRRCGAWEHFHHSIIIKIPINIRNANMICK